MSARQQQQQNDLAKYYDWLCNRYFKNEEMTEEEILNFYTYCRIAKKLIEKASPSAIRNSGLDVEIRKYEEMMKLKNMMTAG